MILNYIDPSSGSLFFQMILSTAISCVLFLKQIKTVLLNFKKRFFRVNFNRKNKYPSTNLTIDKKTGN